MAQVPLRVRMLAANRTIVIHEEGGQPLMVDVALRASTTAPARVKCALVAQVPTLGPAVFDEFRLEMN